jgi:hypothetical protein
MKIVKVAAVRLDSNGRLRTTPISRTPEPDLAEVWTAQSNC